MYSFIHSRNSYWASQCVRHSPGTQTQSSPSSLSCFLSLSWPLAHYGPNPLYALHCHPRAPALQAPWLDWQREPGAPSARHDHRRGSPDCLRCCWRLSCLKPEFLGWLLFKQPRSVCIQHFCPGPLATAGASFLAALINWLLSQPLSVQSEPGRISPWKSLHQNVTRPGLQRCEGGFVHHLSGLMTMLSTRHSLATLPRSSGSVARHMPKRKSMHAN